jgi:hypothetical protein
MKKLMMMLLLTLGASIAYGQAAKNDGVRQPAQLFDVPNAALKIGFADDWDVKKENETLIGVSPDGKVRILAAVVQNDDEDDRTDKIIGEWLVDFKRMKNAKQRKVNDFGLLSGSGTAKSKADNEPVEYLGDMVMMIGGKVVIVIAFGSKDALKDNAADIELARNSFKKPD